MSNVIEFPNSRKPVVSAHTFLKMRAAPPINFKADLFLFASGEVGFSIAYPNVKLSRRVVAGALRKAAAALESSPHD